MVNTEAEFAEQLMIDLITQGHSGNDLHEQFRKEVIQIRPAIKAMFADSKKVAVSKAAYVSYGDAFGGMDEEERLL